MRDDDRCRARLPRRRVLRPALALVATLAFPLPANIVFSLMGVPEQDYAQLKKWCGYRAALSFGRLAAGDQVETATTMAAYRGYMRDLVAAKAETPGDDLTSDLIAGTWPSARACTSAWAPTSASWRPSSRSPN
ncbi:MAG TPA: hypothetical protein VIY52_23565 [Streptosporangiaceae bacterium]